MIARLPRLVHDWGGVSCLHYVRDLRLEMLAVDWGIPLKCDQMFCVGPDVGFSLWYGRRLSYGIA